MKIILLFYCAAAENFLLFNDALTISSDLSAQINWEVKNEERTNDDDDNYAGFGCRFALCSADLYEHGHRIPEKFDRIFANRRRCRIVRDGRVFYQAAGCETSIETDFGLPNQNLLNH